MMHLGHKIYDTVQAILLSVGIALVVMLLINIPNMRDAIKQEAAQRKLAIAQESREHCERFGLQAGDHSHVMCVIEINRIRDDAVRAATTTW